MKARKLLDTIIIAERLKGTIRHCYTSTGRPESVAEHCWMAALMAYFMRDEFPEADMDKVIKMCLIHDLGECFTGDIPIFDKNEAHEEKEGQLLYDWLDTLPEEYAMQMRELYKEMAEQITPEAKIYKAIDRLEALIQHNISDISTWIPQEHKLNLTYANNEVEFSDYLKSLRQAILEDTIKKLKEAGL